MEIHLPIADVAVPVTSLLGVGGAAGLVSGLFGVGGGFLMTPLLIFLGVSPGVAVASGANQMVATSTSAVMTHLRKGNVDVRMGVVLTVSGLLGSSLGVVVFRLLSELGHIDVVIHLLYLVLLSIIGVMLSVEGVAALRGGAKAESTGPEVRKEGPAWEKRLPFRMRFERSGMEASVLLPGMVGFAVGLLAALMGVGGGFFSVPAMIYLLRMPTRVAVGTSLFQIIFVAANTTLLQAWINNTVDILLALMLILGGVIGAQVGARLGALLPGNRLRLLLGVLVLAVGLKMGLNLVEKPANLFSLETAPVTREGYHPGPHEGHAGPNAVPQTGKPAAAAGTEH